MAATARRQLITMTLQWARKAQSSKEYVELAHILLELTGSSGKTSTTLRKQAKQAADLLGLPSKSGK